MLTGINPYVQLGLAFIAICMLAVMVDRFVLAIEAQMKRINGIPDNLEPLIAYTIVCSLGSLICWQGHFDIFAMCGFTWWQHPWLGWILTGMVIGGGTGMLGKMFRMAREIPSIVTNGGSSYGWSTTYNELDTFGANVANEECKEDGTGSA